MRKTLELSREGVGDNLKSMEGLRGLAIGLVFLAHVVTLTEAYVSERYLLMQALNFVNHYGAVGVELFFILSGYLIYGSLISRNQPFSKFIKRRYVRLYPVYTLVFVAYLAISVVAPSVSKIPSGSWVDQFTFLAASFLLLPPLVPIKPLITVAWSLSYEMLFYFLTPVLIWLTNFRSIASPNRALILLGIGALFWISCAVWGGHVRMLLFFSGMILYEVTAKQEKSLGASFGLICLLVSFSYFVPKGDTNLGAASQVLILFLSLSVFCGSVLSKKQNSLQKVFCWTPLRLLGNMSYSFYLLHGLVIKAVNIAILKVYPPTGNANLIMYFAIWVLQFICCWIVSFWVFKLVERPYSLEKRLPS